MNATEAIENYNNGNVEHVKAWLVNSTISLGEFLAFYIWECRPDEDQIIRFVKRLEQA